MSKVRCFWIVVLGMAVSAGIFFHGHAWADVERYMAVPMGQGGYIFILDTKDGHAWTWNNSTPGQLSARGENQRFTYQGNVRQNMKPGKPPLNIPVVKPDKY